MNQFYCVGVSHKTCPIEIREKIAFPEKNLPEALAGLRTLEGVRECFILSTCNRVEIYARGEDSLSGLLNHFLSSFHGLKSSELNAYVYCLEGGNVFHHLFRVAAGLESMVVGETEIHGQLKEAFQLAQKAGTLDSMLYQLAERALRVGKKARTETKISRGAISVASVAVELAEKIFGRLSGEKVLVLGTGEMSEKTIENLVRAGAGKIVVASRNFERALELSQKFGAEPILFSDWLRALRTSDIVISSTAAPHPVVRYDDVKMVIHERRHKPLFFIDIAVPRDIESTVQTLDDVYLYDIDDLESVIQANIRERKKEIDACERLIEREMEQFSGWLEELGLKPVLERLIRHFDEAAEEEMRKLKAVFPGREQELRDLWTRVRKKAFHKPLQKLRLVSKEGSLPRYLQILRELFSEDIPEKKNSDSESVQRKKV